MKTLIAPFWAMLLLCAAIALPIADDKDNREYKNAYNLILEERWDEAERAFADFAANFPQSRWRDDAEFWVCYAKHKGRLSPEESFRCFREFVDRHPHSEWVDDALRTLVVLGKSLAETGKPEYLSEARAAMKRASEDQHGHPDDELLAMLESVAERNPEGAAKVVFKYFDRAQDERLRAKIVALMEDLETPEVTQKLVKILHSDASLKVRENAVEALVDRRGSDQVRDALLEAARSSDYPASLREDIISELDDFEFPGKLELLRDIILTETDRNLAEEAMDTLVDSGAPGALAILFQVYEATDNRQKREDILEAIADTESAEALTFLNKVALTEQDIEMAGIAVNQFEEFPEDMALSSLEHVLASDAAWRVKVAAVYTIDDFESDRAVSLLTATLKRETHPEIRKAAIEALGDTERASAVPILIDIVRNDPNPAMRKRAIEALDDLDELPEAQEALLKLLEERLEAEDNDK